MKRILFLSLALAVAMTGFAQKHVLKMDKNATQTATFDRNRVFDGSEAESMQFVMPEHMTKASLPDEYLIMTTYYDLQSNSAIGNRMTTWPDGTVSAVATWDMSGTNAYPDRGAGYNYYDGNNFGEEPSARIEPEKSGWPTIAAIGNGEIMASHASGVNVYYRPTKGEGEWTLVHNFPEVTWPRIVVSGPNNEYVHIVMAYQENIGTSTDPHYLNHVYYSRSTDGGQTWSDPVEPELIDNTEEGMFRNQISADDYVMASNGNDVAIMFSGYTYDVFYLISHDNGETWERQVIARFPMEDFDAYEFNDYPTGMPAPVITSDNSHCIAIDNNGTVHAAFALFRWQATDDGHYTYWPANNFGVVYWNSEYTNEQGGHEIPLVGEWSQDAILFPELGDTIGYSLYDERVMALAEADGHQHLHFTGVVDENGDGEIGYENVTGATWHYRSFGLTTQPALSVDNRGNVVMMFNTWSETRVPDLTGIALRGAYVVGKDYSGEWYDEYGTTINISESFIHSIFETFYTTAAARAYNGEFWTGFFEDDFQGLFLDRSDDYPNSNNGQLTENQFYAIKVVPDWEGWGLEDNEAVNPMTSMRVYPNPVQDQLNVEINASQASLANIAVYNITGQKVMEQNVNISTGINRPAINTTSLTSGIYFVTVKANGFENSQKFIVK